MNCESRRDLCCVTKVVVGHQRSHGKYIGTILVSGKVHNGTQYPALQGTQALFSTLCAQQTSLNLRTPKSTPTRSTPRSSNSKALQQGLRTPFARPIDYCSVWHHGKHGTPFSSHGWEESQTLGAGVTGGFELPDMGSGSPTSSPQEQHVFVTTEPSLRPATLPFIYLVLVCT